MASNQKATVPPLCLGLILADAIWVDPGSGKRTILGTFSTIFAPRFPAVHHLMAIHCALTDGHGNTEVVLKLVDMKNEESLFETKGMLEFKDPRMVAEIDFHLPNLVFPHEGEYRFQLFGNGEFLMERRLSVLQSSGKEPSHA